MQEPNNVDAAQGEPAAQEEGETSGETSWNMSDPAFESSIEILDEDGKPVTQEQMVPGKKYRVKLHFKEPDGSKKFFKGATRKELEEVGLSEEDLEGIEDGEWLYVPLGADVTAELGENTELLEDVKVVKDGKGLLKRYDKVDDSMIDEFTVEFRGTLSEDADVSKLDIVGGDGTGNYEPDHSKEPVLSKVAMGYDPENHYITYKVKITNPTKETLSGGFLFADSFSVFGQDGKYPKYVDGSLKISDEKFSGNVNYDKESGKLSFTYPSDVPAGESVEIEYQLDVTDLLDQLPEALGSFLVNNEATASPPEGQSWAPMTDKDEERVFFGTLEKKGWIRETPDDTSFWGYKNPIEWLIEAYDPYLELYDTTFTDTLPKGITFDDIIGVLFEYDENGETKQKAFVYKKDTAAWNPDIKQYMTRGEGNTVTFDFSEAPEDLKKQLFQSNGHRLKMHILTKGENRYGTYTNKVDATLPSETKSRESEATVNYGLAGIHAVKEGEIIDGGDKLRYTVEVDVSANVGDEAPGAYGIIAGLIDRMHVAYAENDKGYIDTSKAIDVESVIARYTEGDEEKEWSFTKDGESGHTFGVYDVSELGEPLDGALKDNNWKKPYTDSTAIVLNPHHDEKARDHYQYEYTKLYGAWPEALQNKQVTIVYTYTIDPKKAFFVDSKTHDHISYHDAATLAEYISLMGDIIVYNDALAGINDSQSSDDEELNLVSPLTKQGDVKVDLVNEDEKLITYTVTFQNGENNDSALPTDAKDIFFVDQYDKKLRYVPGTLKATRKMPSGETWDFLYQGKDDWTGRTIRANWKDFQDSVYGRTLAADFAGQTGRYTYIFTYDMKAGPDMPSDEASVTVDNNATVEYTGDNGETKSLNHVTSHNDFPTGALTKQATLEETGKVSFYIEINTDAEDLSKDTDYLQIEDEASEETTEQYLKLEGNSIRVEKYDKDSGGWKELTLSGNTWGDDNDSTWSGPGTWMKKLYEDKPNKFALRVPDQAHLRIHYAYALTEEGKKQDHVAVNNSVKVEGFETLSDEVKTTFPTSSIRGTEFSHYTAIPIIKSTQGMNTPVSDVRFVLYVPNTNDETHDDAIQEAKRAGKENLEYEGVDDPLEPVQVTRTGNDGRAKMDWGKLKADGKTIYGIMETYTPSGYVKLEQPIFVKIGKDRKLELLNENQLNGQVSLSEDGKTLKIANPIVPPDTGSLTVTKSVTGKEGDTTKDWHFHVELSDKTVNGTYGDMTFTNGVAEFTLKHEEKKTATGLPSGITYTVTETEANQDGYSTTPTGENGTILKDDEASAKFLNQKPKPGPDTGSLSVKKTVTGSGGDRQKDWYFRVELSDKTINGTYGEMTFKDGVAEFTLKSGDVFIATGLPDGVTYTVTEDKANQDGYTTTPSGDTGTIPGGGTADAEFVNSKSDQPGPNTGNLIVRKTVSGIGDRTKDWHFRVELGDKSISGTYGEMTFADGIAEFALEDGETKSAAGLPAGITYTVTEMEADQDGYGTFSAGSEGTIPEGGEASAKFLNQKPKPEPDTGSLSVKKTVTGSDGDLRKEWHFRVELSDKTINGAYGEMTFKDGVAEFTLKSGDIRIATGLPDGITYTVTEVDANQDGYTTTVKDNDTDRNDGEGTIEKTTLDRVTFTNAKPKEPSTGNLAVSKTVTGKGDKTKEWHFRVELSDKSVNGTYGDMTFVDGVAEFTLKHGESKTATGLPPGITYTVTEQEAGENGYTTSKTGETGTIPKGNTASAVFLNGKDEPHEPGTGALTVVKIVTGRGDQTKEWHFRVELSDKSINGWYGELFFTDGVAEFTLKHGENKTAVGLPEGVTYTVTETEANQDGYITFQTGETGTIPEGKTVSAVFRNGKDDTHTPNTGTLTVVKTVTGEGDRNREWHFRVELSDKSINGWYGELFFTDGVAEFTLKHGENKTAIGLPEGVTYQVTEQEANQNGYATTYTEENGTIPGEQDRVVIVVNDKPDEPDLSYNPSGSPNTPSENPPETPDRSNVVQTGETSPLTLWIAVMALSLLGVLLTGRALYKGRKEAKREEKK